MGKIDFINIDSEGNYFDTVEQIKIRDRIFSDRYAPSTVGANASGFFTVTRENKVNSPTGVEVYATPSSSIDCAGNERKFLVNTVDPYASSSVLAYRNGIEIVNEQNWVAGTVKILAGEPGHIIDRGRYGDPDHVLISSKYFTDIDKFSPSRFVEIGGDPHLVTYPIVIESIENVENFDGVIEPMPIRTLVPGKSTYFPYEAHGVRGTVGNGNIDWRFASDAVVSEYVVEDIVQVPFLDDADPITLNDGIQRVVLGIEGYVNHTLNSLAPFKDYTSPEWERGISYLVENQRTSTVGFDWDNSDRGTDSIAYGGLIASSTCSKRLGRRTILNEKDSETFTGTGTKFNDTNTIIFDTNQFENQNYSTKTYTIQYPEMLPVGYRRTEENGTWTLVNNLTGIKINRDTKPGLIVWNLKRDT